MTEHHPHPNHAVARPPTPKQQRYLRDLAVARGISFVPPRTRREASRLIDELKRVAPEPSADRRREIRAVQDALAAARFGAERVDSDLEFADAATDKEVW